MKGLLRVRRQLPSPMGLRFSLRSPSLAESPHSFMSRHFSLSALGSPVHKQASLVMRAVAWHLLGVRAKKVQFSLSCSLKFLVSNCGTRM